MKYQEKVVFTHEKIQTGDRSGQQIQSMSAKSTDTCKYGKPCQYIATKCSISDVVIACLPDTPL